MRYREVTRDELENLYTHDGISRKELRFLLRITPNRLTNKVTELFREKLNIFKKPEKSEISLNGFVHSAPKKLLQMFNSVHYELHCDIGNYELFVLSSSPIALDVAIPMVVPKSKDITKEIGRAHFANVSGRINNLNDYKKSKSNAIFIVVDELNLLGFDELFSFTEPIVNIRDLNGMLKDRFNTTELLTNGIISWFLSSPMYEGRLGGNSFSPISPFDQQYKCEPRVLTDFQKELLSVPLPYFTQANRSASMDYNGKMKNKLKFVQMPDLNYRLEKNLGNVDKFLETRKPLKAGMESELNLSTPTLVLDSISSRPLESFVQKPILPAKVLTHTDLPLLFTNSDLAIDASEDELFEYSMDFSQLIYQSHLRFPHSSYEFVDTAGAVKDVMDSVRSSMPELHELMIYGILFNTSPIGGLGEHLTRISNSQLRAGKNVDQTDALKKSEDMFEEMITKLFDEFEKPIRELYYKLEDKRAERDQIKTHKLRNLINSVLFELNNTYKDGWGYELFEAAMKKRSDHSKSKIDEIFKMLIAQKEVTERSPGLYMHILGFDRYL